MALNVPNEVLDGFENTTGGMDAGRRANLIGLNQCAAMRNVINRGGVPRTRPGFRKMTNSISNPFFSYSVEGFRPGSAEIGTRSSDVFTGGVFQSACYYAPPGGEECMVASIGGRIFKIIPRTYYCNVREIEIPDKRNNSQLPLAYMVQADKYLIVQDGESLPIIFDGVRARRAAPTGEVPVGTLMAYGMGRLVVVRPQSREILFGDLFGSYPGPNPGDSVLKFNETGFLAEGGSATVPFALGEITAAIFYPQQDTASGQGELLVFCEHGMASFFLSLPREQWKESNFQRLGLLDIGGIGHRAFVPVNGDIWFRSGQGWRTYRQARAEINGWAQLPLSTEMGNYVDNDTEGLLKYASAIFFDNRLITTRTPIPNKSKNQTDVWDNPTPGGRLYHNGLNVLDFNVLSSFGDSTKPAWDGDWTKIRVYQLIEGKFNGEHRAFAFGVATGQSNILIFEISKDDVEDFDAPISSYIVSRSMMFDSPYNEKDLYGMDIWHDSVRKDTEVTVQYKPDQYPEWIDWKTYNLEKNGTCGEVNCGMCPTIRDGFYPRRTLGKPDNFCDNLNTNRDTKRGYEFQTKIAWTGNMAIRRLRMRAQKLPEKTTATC